jgi:Zn-dependent protease
MEFILILPAILFAITVHEYAHGWMAERCGDPTARLAGRLTLNPLKHLDPIGTLMLIMVKIGWAKPVPINPAYFRNPRKDIIWVSLAGPGANVLSAFLAGMTFRIMEGGAPTPLLKILIYAVLINLVLAAFNIIPIPPLDGSKVLRSFLPTAQAFEFSKIEPYGPFILISLILLGRLMGCSPIWSVIHPFVKFFSTLFIGGEIPL